MVVSHREIKMKTINSHKNHNHSPSSKMSRNRLGSIVFLFILLGLLLPSCTSPTTNEPATEIDSTSYDGKKIVFVDSYHTGYEWSDDIESSINNTLADTGIELQTIHMDTKRNSEEDFGEEAALKAIEEIQSFDPDVVIACDDNAQKFLIVPYLKDTDLPIVFCGVNWDATAYGYPTSNVTGMVEIDAITQMVDLLELFTEGNNIAFLTEDTNTERKVFEVHNERFFENRLNGVFVSDFEEFKSEYLRLQDEVDMLYIGNNASLTDWNETEAEAFISENAKIPSGSIYDWMTPYVLLVVGKTGEEQGKWSAETALNILDGTPVIEIPLTENKESSLILNLTQAENLDVVFTPSMLRHAEFYGE